MKKNEEANTETVETPKKEPLQEGQVSIVMDGKEVVFTSDLELPGMPEAGRLRKLASAYVRKCVDVAEQNDLLLNVRQAIMMELRNEGRSGFAYRSGTGTYIFEINKPAESLEIKRKK